MALARLSAVGNSSSDNPASRALASGRPAAAALVAQRKASVGLLATPWPARWSRAMAYMASASPAQAALESRAVPVAVSPGMRPRSMPSPSRVAEGASPALAARRQNLAARRASRWASSPAANSRQTTAAALGSAVPASS